MIKNNTQAVKLAKLVLSRWDESPGTIICELTHQKEPLDVQEARRILASAKIRWNAKPLLKKEK